MQLVDLKLVNAGGTPVAWPGTEQSIGVPTISDVVAVWIGVSLDGTTNASYPLTTPLATIQLTYPRVYQGISATVGGDTNLYFNSLLDYERRVAACCVNNSDDSSSDSAGSCATVNWVHQDNEGGSLVITVNGDPVVNSTTDESGRFTLNEGDVVESTVTGGSNSNRLIVEEATDGELFDQNDTGNPVIFSFEATCGDEYTITGLTLGGE